MDRITKTLLNDFLKTQEIVNKDESSNFEKFVNYSILSNEYNKMMVGGVYAHPNKNKEISATEGYLEHSFASR